MQTAGKITRKYQGVFLLVSLGAPFFGVHDETIFLKLIKKNCLLLFRLVPFPHKNG